MIQTASFTGFLRTLLIILAIYYGLKIITRLAAPYLLKYFSTKMQNRYGGTYTYQNKQSQPQRPKEGETVIDKMPSQEQSSNSKVGEYIDFEEIE